MTHPAFVHIPDSRTEGVRSYREPATPHPIQRTFLTGEGERQWVDTLRGHIVAARLGEADRMVTDALAPFEGRIAQLAKMASADDVWLEGWEDLMPILAEHEGPAITAITVGLTNEPDLVFDGGDEHEPTLVIALYSDDSFPFSNASRDALLAECLSDDPAFAGEEEDVEFYAMLSGLAALNSALIQSKHRYYLRDGRDGIEGRAPGGYCEYVLGTWVRALRFLQALERAADDHGLPDGARLVAGTFGLHTDFASLLREGEAPAATQPAAEIAPVATLTMKKWEPKHDPLADLYAPAATDSGSALRKRVMVEEPAAAPAPAAAPEPVATTPLPAMMDAAVTPKRGFLARLFGRFRRA